MKTAYERTTNEHYGGINNRFDRRARVLRRLGFTYHRLPELGFAVFKRGEPIVMRTKTIPCKAIPASTVMHADTRSWFDALKGLVK